MRFMTDDPNQIALKPQLAPRIANTFTRFINGEMEAAGDDFRVDPDNINFEEIRQKLQELDPNIPLSVSYDFGSMPKFTRDRIYPEFDMMKKMSAKGGMQKMMRSMKGMMPPGGGGGMGGMFGGR